LFLDIKIYSIISWITRLSSRAVATNFSMFQSHNLINFCWEYTQLDKQVFPALIECIFILHTLVLLRSSKTKIARRFLVIINLMSILLDLTWMFWKWKIRGQKHQKDNYCISIWLFLSGLAYNNHPAIHLFPRPSNCNFLLTISVHASF
jgi:hypothetical protein